MGDKISFTKRDTYHWDVFNGFGRIFSIRGEPNSIWIRGHKEFSAMESPQFKSATLAMAWICEQLADQTTI